MIAHTTSIANKIQIQFIIIEGKYSIGKRKLAKWTKSEDTVVTVTENTIFVTVNIEVN